MFWRNLLRNPRVWLTIACAVLAFVVGRFSLPGQTAMSWVVEGGYWALLLLVALFGWACWRAFGAQLRAFRPTRRHGVIAVFLAASGAVLLSHERYGFKVLADEALLLGTSMSIHYDRKAAYPVRATDVQGPFQILQRVMDKRPFFYPFLVSLAHDFTGYRPANAFYVNTVLGFVFLLLLFGIGRKLGGSDWSGVLLVLLFTGLPLFSQQMKGGGFDLLNIVMIAGVLVLAWSYAERRDEATLEPLCLAAALLAFTRYESILFVVPVAALALWGWAREKRVILTWPVMVLPLFLTFCLLQNRVFAMQETAWELAGRPGSTTVFGLQYVAENLGHALGFFFDTTGYQPNSPFFAAVGLAAAPFFGLWIVRVLRQHGSSTTDVATAWIGMGLFGIWALLMLYFWGQFDHPVIHRLSLPVHLLLAIAVAVVGRLFLRERGWKIVCGAAAVALVVFSLPSMARRAYAATYSPAVEMEWRGEFLERFPDRDYLFIDNDSTFWIAHHVPATPATQARAQKDGLIFHLRNHSFSAMYVMQHFRIDPNTGQRTMEPTDEIGPDFQLETLWERRIETLFIGRISRITEIRQDGKVAAEAGPLKIAPHTPGAPANRTDAEWDAAKKAYVDRWLKQLP